MKTIILTAALLATSAHAQISERFCEVHGNLSETIMKSRQAGVPLSGMLKTAGDDTLIRAMVMMAYQVPRMEVEENKRNAISDFRAERELKCFEALERHKARKAAE
jgi:hypothetical protein